MDEDFAAGHAAMTSSIDGANKVTGVAVDANTTSVHFRTRPVICIPFYKHLAACHLGSQVHSGVSFDTDRARRQSGGDQLDAAAIALPDKCVVIRCRTSGLEKLTELLLNISLLNRGCQ